MTQTVPVEFRGHGFWAFDAVSAVFLKYLIDAATQSSDYQQHAWLADAVKDWRTNSVISDFALILDDAWSAEQVKTVSELAAAACDALSKRDRIPAEEIESWIMIDDLRCFARGLPFITTASAIRLGRAMIQLINGSLPASPPGTWWFFATEDSPLTINMDGPVAT